jgi:gamma-glutamyltranspeptidase / glutathione hydrolase
LPLSNAIALPNIYFGGGGLEVEQNTSLSAMADELGKFGQKVRPVDLGSKVNGAQRTASGWTGASDPRSEGTSATIDAKGKVTVTKPRASEEAPTEDVG